MKNKINMSSIANKIKFIYGDECEKNTVGIVIFSNGTDYFFDAEYKNKMSNEEVETLLLRGALVHTDGKYVKPYSFDNGGVSFSESGYTKVNTPNLFTWKDSPLEGKIYKNQSDYRIDFNIDDYKVNKGITYYVDQSKGNDTNDGLSSSTSFRSLSKAITQTDVGEVVMCGGSLFYINGMKGTTISKDIIIRGYLGNQIMICNHDAISPSLWTQNETYNKVYSTPKTNVYCVVDSRRYTEDGDTLSFTKVTSLEECQNTSDSFYYDDTNVYVNYKNGTAPRYDLYIIDNSKCTLEVSGATVFLENLRILGGFTASNGSNIYAKNCRFEYSGCGSCYNINGGNSIAYNCIAVGSSNDGFSYSTCNAIEINCIGKNNGMFAPTGISNGSTSHVGSKVIRVNGQYYNNYGPNVADVQDNTQSWNLGCFAKDSLTSTTTQCCNYQAQEGAPQVFLDGCISKGSYNSIYINQGGSMYLKNCIIQKYAIGTASTGVLNEY